MWKMKDIKKFYRIYHSFMKNYVHWLKKRKKTRMQRVEVLYKVNGDKNSTVK
jgi:hypothetical protein